MIPLTKLRGCAELIPAFETTKSGRQVKEMVAVVKSFKKFSPRISLSRSRCERQTGICDQGSSSCRRSRCGRRGAAAPASDNAAPGTPAPLRSSGSTRYTCSTWGCYTSTWAATPAPGAATPAPGATCSSIELGSPAARRKPRYGSAKLNHHAQPLIVLMLHIHQNPTASAREVPRGLPQRIAYCAR